MTLNYGKIFSTVQIERLSDSEYARITELARKERNYILGNTHLTTSGMPKKAQERLIMNPKYSDESELSKALITAMITFPKNEDFAKVLLDNGYNLNRLNKLSNYAKLAKDLRLKPDSLTPEDESVIKVCNGVVGTLMKIMAITYGITDANVVMNRINALLVFQPGLLEEKKPRRNK